MLNPNVLWAGHNPQPLLPLSCDTMAPLIFWLFIFSPYKSLLLFPPAWSPSSISSNVLTSIAPLSFPTPFWQSPSPKLIQLFLFSVPLSRILGAVGEKKSHSCRLRGLTITASITSAPSEWSRIFFPAIVSSLLRAQGIHYFRPPFSSRYHLPQHLCPHSP